MPKTMKLIFVATAYVVAALFAQAVAPEPGGVVPVWPAAGVGFAALLALGSAAVPVIFGADLIASLLAGKTVQTGLALALGNTAALCLGALLTLWALRGQKPFANAKSMCLFLLVGPVAASLTAAMAGVGIMGLTMHPASGSARAMWSWFLSDLTGIVLLAPLAEAWRGHPLGLPPTLRRLEGWLLFTGAAIICWLVFGLRYGVPLNLYPLPFAFIPVTAWATFRADSRTLTLMLALIFPVSVLFTLAGLGPFGHLFAPLSLHLLQIFSAITAITTYIIHALSKERLHTFSALKLSEAALLEAKSDLERRVEERTRKLNDALDELHGAEETYRTIFESASEGIYRADATGRFVRANPGLATILGYDSPTQLKEMITDISRQVFTRPEDRQRLYETLSRTGHATDFEASMRRKDGAQIWVSLSVRPVIAKDGRIMGTEGIIQDITQRKYSEEELKRRATLDPLTGTANRHFFERTFQTMLAQAERNNTGMALLYIDLDDFKIINDSMGHQAGDTVLQVFAQRIQTRMRKSDLLARLGGDEFAMLLCNTSDPGHVTRIAEEILIALDKPIQVEGGQVTVGASIGGSLYPEGGTTMDNLLRRADQAMYTAKRLGKNRYHIDISPKTA